MSFKLSKLKWAFCCQTEMMSSLSSVYFIFIIYLQVKCEDKVNESKNALPYFRRLVEEITEDTTVQSRLSDESRSNKLVSFLIENVHKIYNELDEFEHIEITTPLTTRISATNPTEGLTHVAITIENVNSTISNHTDTYGSEIEVSSESNVSIMANATTILRPKNNTMLRKLKKWKKSRPSNITRTTPYLDEMAQYTNLTVINLSDIETTEKGSTTSYNLTIKEELMHLSKNLIFFETDRRQRDNNINYFAHNASYLPTGTDTGLRSCISCNNILQENCNDPKNRLISSTVCERDDDVCYSQHTPFGVIDRGCYNVNHNITTYVCSCNLCNYISISEMPYVFTTKRDWVDNVIELSRTRHLRKSVFKDMSCLKCESNASAKSDMLDTANCLEGNIGSLPTEQCEDNEVCAVRAIKHDGYLWRGCVKRPIFNFWWTYCDSDLCNYDIVTSIYDDN